MILSLREFICYAGPASSSTAESFTANSHPVSRADMDPMVDFLSGHQNINENNKIKVSLWRDCCCPLTLKTNENLVFLSDPPNSWNSFPKQKPLAAYSTPCPTLPVNIFVLGLVWHSVWSASTLFPSYPSILRVYTSKIYEYKPFFFFFY